VAVIDPHSKDTWIDQQHLVSLHDQRGGQIDGGRGLPGPAFIIGYGQDHNFIFPVLH
jgi:hypothetical protein